MRYELRFTYQAKFFFSKNTVILDPLCPRSKRLQESQGGMGYGTLPPHTLPVVVVEAQPFSSAYLRRSIEVPLFSAAQLQRSPGPGQRDYILCRYMDSIGDTRTSSLLMPVYIRTCRYTLPVLGRSHGSSEGIGTPSRMNYRPFGRALMRYIGPPGRRRNSAALLIGFWEVPSCLVTTITHTSYRRRTMLQFQSAYGALCALPSVFGPVNRKDWRPTGFGP